MPASPAPDQGPSLGDRLFAWVQYPLPQHALSRGMHRLARCRWLKRPLVRWFSRRFRIDLDAAQEPDPMAYRDLNSFFTRALRSEARPVDPAPDAIVSPVDGAVSQAGGLTGETLVQAKGQGYSVDALLGGDSVLADIFRNGLFATLYLSPQDYHRIHLPCAGTLRRMIYVPGRLFSVNDRTTRAVPGLFARNERVVTLFDTEAGPMALVMVGAIFVGSIETVWGGEITPPHGQRVMEWQYPDGPQFQPGEEIGRFNMGSTVILLWGPKRAAWSSGLTPGATVRLGQRIGTLQSG